jgi:AcrR family transcriptional regulator
VSERTQVPSENENVSPLYRQLKPGPGLSAEQVAAHQRGRMLGAMVELVAERGYRGVTVRDVTRAAGVSKASFYDSFDGKEDCFIATYDAVLHEAARGVLVGERKGREGHERLRAGLAAFAAKCAARPKAARLALVESLVAGPAVLEHVSRRLGLFETLIANRFPDVGADADAPSPLAKGIVAGVSFHARDCVLRGSPECFLDRVDPLLEWALSLDEQEASKLPAVEVVKRPEELRALPTESLREPDGERDSLLTAAASLAAEAGYRKLTPRRIEARAKAPKGCLAAHFDGVAECFLAAIDRRMAPLVEQSFAACGEADTWAAGVLAALHTLLSGLAADSDLARLAFVEVFSAGSEAVEWRHRLIGVVAERLRALASPDERPDRLMTEASVAAGWAVIHDQVGRGDSARLVAKVDLLAFFVLAPALGAERARAEIVWRRHEPAPERLRVAQWI